MVMDSVVFLFRFLPLFILGYFLSPIKLRNFVLFLGGLVFLSLIDPMYVGIMLISTGLNYVYGRLLSVNTSRLLGYLYLSFALLTNAVPFVYFFFVFPRENTKLVFGMYMILSMSYVLSCYRKEVVSQKNILHFGVYASFFPVLFAGILPDYEKMAAQIKERKYGILHVQSGIKRFIVGLSERVLLAGGMERLRNEVCAVAPDYFTFSHAWIGAISLSFIVYYTLAGYAEMAKGLAQILGFSVPDNFNYPFFSASVTEFWQKFLMSVVNWVKKNIYEPVAGEKEGFFRSCLGILAMWLFMGIWFRQGMSGILAGAWFGIIILLEKVILLKIFKIVPYVIRCIYTHVVVSVGWIILFGTSLQSTIEYVKHMLWYGQVSVFDSSLIYLLGKYIPWIFFSFFAALPTFHKVTTRLKAASSGGAMGFYRAVNKLFPAVLFILSVIYLV